MVVHFIFIVGRFTGACPIRASRAFPAPAFPFAAALAGADLLRTGDQRAVLKLSREPGAELKFR
jgi:hypothetical protein